MKKESLEGAVRQMQTGKYDSAFTAEMMQDYCWYDGKPVNYKLTDIVQTQDLKPVCVEKGEVFIFTKELFVKHHRRIGFNPYIQEISEIEAIDINNYFLLFHITIFKVKPPLAGWRALAFFI